MSTYLASVTAATYTQLDDWFYSSTGDTMPITHYVYPSLVSKARVDLDIAAPSLAFFSDAFGPYPFVSEKYGVALCPLGGGMEHQTLTSYGSMLITGDHSYDWIYVHELAHMWFGDLITCKSWEHIWLNESFASYAEALWFEHLEGAATLKSYMESEDRPRYWDGPILRDPDNTILDYYFDLVVYDKGSWVLHMLRRVIGDEAFFEILRDFCADPRYRYSAAVTADFGDLRGALRLFAFVVLLRWLTRTDRLIYRCSNKGYADRRIQPDDRRRPVANRPLHDARRFPDNVASGVIDTIFWVDDRHDEFHVALPRLSLGAELDPGHWILCDKTELTPTGDAVPSRPVLDQNYPNPFNPTTTIRFGLNEPAAVSLRIYDAAGRLVRVLIEAPLSAGTHARAWDGMDSRGAAVSSGVYLYRLDAGSFSRTRKMILIR